jgi:hypothetical protein
VDVRNIPPETENMGPVGARTIKIRIGYSQDQTRFRREFVDQYVVVLVVYREIRSNVPG